MPRVTATSYPDPVGQQGQISSLAFLHKDDVNYFIVKEDHIASHFITIGVMINMDSQGHLYFTVRVDVAIRTLPAPYEKSKSLGSEGSMVARLKLKEIDGRAPLEVEPAA
ncbi:rRNA intron-encoded homing endonuclease [Cucumis melo var. makuwa]|uniref:rRNA intron-encoded homing endonuclease n=1 Tax=Cucumis melo var. makuwa TaxID=1194695 RepID=A0A5D3DQQ4_CUCMM|nr:rRNA intron-encoded homing endonuclease [Cucumis melo var. makuwa]